MKDSVQIYNFRVEYGPDSNNLGVALVLPSYSCK